MGKLLSLRERLLAKEERLPKAVPKLVQSSPHFSIIPRTDFAVGVPVAFDNSIKEALISASKGPRGPVGSRCVVMLVSIEGKKTMPQGLVLEQIIAMGWAGASLQVLAGFIRECFVQNILHEMPVLALGAPFVDGLKFSYAPRFLYKKPPGSSLLGVVPVSRIQPDWLILVTRTVK
ncbi:MAG: hypothetical protein AAB421_01900 [Patescibacteria group bacterium]